MRICSLYFRKILSSRFVAFLKRVISCQSFFWKKAGIFSFLSNVNFSLNFFYSIQSFTCDFFPPYVSVCSSIPSVQYLVSRYKIDATDCNKNKNKKREGGREKRKRNSLVKINLYRIKMPLIYRVGGDEITRHPCRKLVNSEGIIGIYLSNL